MAVIKELLYYLVFSFCFSLALVGYAHTEQIQCHDVLASSQYPQPVLKSKLKCIRGFEYAFGKSFQPLATNFLASGKRYLGVNCLWSDTHQFGDKDIPLLRKCASDYAKIIEQFPHVDLELTPFTEHNLSNPDKYLDIAQAECPKCTIVNSVYKGAFSKRYKSEVHGTHAAPKEGRYNYSFDGTNAVDSDVKSVLQKHSKAERFYLWHPRYNLRYRDKDTTPRPQRIKEAKDRSPTPDFIASIDWLFGVKEPYKIPKNWLVKSHAEKHDKNDLKGDKLLIISPIKADQVSLKRGGKEACKLRYYGPFDGGGFRFYSSTMGHQCGANLDVFIGKKKFGTINGGFRSPPYR